MRGIYLAVPVKFISYTCTTAEPELSCFICRKIKSESFFKASRIQGIKGFAFIYENSVIESRFRHIVRIGSAVVLKSENVGEGATQRKDPAFAAESGLAFDSDPTVYRCTSIKFLFFSTPAASLARQLNFNITGVELAKVTIICYTPIFICGDIIYTGSKIEFIFFPVYEVLKAKFLLIAR